MALISSPGDLLPLNSQLAALNRTMESGKFDLLVAAIGQSFQSYRAEENCIGLHSLQR